MVRRAGAPLSWGRVAELAGAGAVPAFLANGMWNAYKVAREQRGAGKENPVAAIEPV